MKKTLVLIMAVALLCVSLFGLSACSTEDTIIVYTESGFAPFEYVANNKIVGVDVDIMNKVGEKLGKKIVFESVGFDTIIDAVAAGKLCNVGAAGISVTAERAEKVDFSNNYYTAKLYVIYKSTESTSYENTTTDSTTGVYWDNLAGKKIAVQTGTTADLFLGDELAENGTLYNTNASIVDCKEYAVALANMGSGDADVIIMDELPAQQLISGNNAYKCAPLYWKGDNADDEAASDVYAICVTKGQTELLNAINEVISELGTAGIQQLVNTHLGL